MTEVVGIEKTGFGIELDLYLDIQGAFDEDKECEHPQHSTRTWVHDTEGAQWYVQLQCPECTTSFPLRAVCLKYRAFAKRGGPHYCPVCEKDIIDWTMLVDEKLKK